MAIADKLEYAKRWVDDIEAALKERKVTIDSLTPLEEYGDLIRAIRSGGSDSLAELLTRLTLEDVPLGAAVPQCVSTEIAGISDAVTANENNPCNDTPAEITTVSDRAIAAKYPPNPTAETLTVSDSVSAELGTKEWMFEYTGKQKAIALSPGVFEIECYGAQGGQGVQNGVLVPNPAYGGYSKGVLTVLEPTNFYLYVGGKGGDASGTKNTYATAGWNGGGRGGADTSDDDAAGAGGGATDIRVTGGEWNNAASLRSRIMVAGGSSGSSYGGSGAYGGGLQGEAKGGAAGTQTSGNAFGVGGDGPNSSGAGGSGGGGGYWGGKPGVASTAANTGAGGGGSGFISGHPGCDAVASESSSSHTGQPNHYSGIVFTDTVMQSNINAGNGKIIIKGSTGDVTASLIPYIRDGIFLCYDGELSTKSTNSWQDISGNNRNTTGGQNVTFGANFATFTGSDNYLLLPSSVNTMFATRRFTAEFRFNLTSLSKRHTILGNYGNSGNSLNMEFSTANRLRLFCDGSPDYTPSTTFNTVLTTLTVVFNGSTATIYKNAASIGSVSIASAPNNYTSVFKLGNDNRGGTSVALTGRIYSVRIYDRALSTAEISQNYAIDTSRF